MSSAFRCRDRAPSALGLCIVAFAALALLHCARPVHAQDGDDNDDGDYAMMEPEETAVPVSDFCPQGMIRDCDSLCAVEAYLGDGAICDAGPKRFR